MFRLIPLLLFVLLAACGSQPTRPAEPAQPPANSTPAQIDSVEVQVAESQPPQVFAHVQGQIGDGCSSLGAITQQRQANQIEITVMIDHSGAQACTMIMQMLDERIQLEGAFPPGAYTLRVNGVEHSFTV